MYSLINTFHNFTTINIPMCDWRIIPIEYIIMYIVPRKHFYSILSSNYEVLVSELLGLLRFHSIL